MIAHCLARPLRLDRHARCLAKLSFHCCQFRLHALDFELVEAILRRGDFAYCGMIGSQTKRRTLENGLAKRGVPVTRFRGDITDFWYRDLSLLWRERPVAIAGATTHGPLFCLERWAWDHGLRVTYRGALTGAPGDEALTAWIIAPPGS